MAVSFAHKVPSTISKYPYYVFLSFRGADTRKNFTDHLYATLTQARIRTFRDENEIEMGDNIKDEIRKAILQESKISLIVLSKNYASSAWCLDELLSIMEHRKSTSYVVLPIFYDVFPSQVRHQTGSFAEAFARHEEQFKSNIEKVGKWRAALMEVAELGGMVLNDKHESHFIRDIVQHIQNKLNYTALCVPPYLIGTEFLVTYINWWLQDASHRVGIASICGIGGIGKTTIAKVIYNLNFQRFQCYSFLSDVREMSQEPNGLLRLQRQLISDTMKGKANKIYSTNDGIIKIREAMCCRSVLLVLDDVDDLDQITKLIGTQIPFHPGSKILITTRHRHLVTEPFVHQMFDSETSSTYDHDLCKVFEVKELGFDESLQLFNWYAFGRNPMIEKYKEYASRAVEHCCGLPLALQVLGSCLSGKSIHAWKSALEKLEAIPDSKVQKIMRISYDSLQNDHDKDLFLNIACLFVGKDVDFITTILDGCGYYTAIGIENLIDRCLLSVNEKNRVMMHQMVRVMGREIVRQESPNPGERSILWHKDAFDVLSYKSGTKTIRCLDLRGLHASHSDDAFLMSSDEVDFETQAFDKMQRLELLQMDHVKLKGNYKNFPKGLIWLHWHEFSLESLPLDLDIKRLVALDVQNSRLKHVWKNSQYLPNLKILNLSHSHELLQTPNFIGLHSLEKLMLKDCIKLIMIDQSIGELKRLLFLNLKGCQSLRKLPRTIGSLESVEELILCGCSRLDDLPKEVKNMKSLRMLDLNETGLYGSVSWLSWLLSLRRNIGLGLCWAYLPSSLVKLSLESCKVSDDAIPNDLSSLASLKCLNLGGNPIHSLPKSICRLTKLDELSLVGCTELKSIPKLPVCPINGLYVKMIDLLDIVSSIPHLLSIKRFVIFGCNKLREIQGVFKLEPVESFEEEQIKSLFNVDYIESYQVQIYNYLTDTKIISTPQVINECGIMSSFVPGTKVPTSFHHRYKGSKVRFSLPPYSGEKIRWLNLCILFSLASCNVFGFLPWVEIINETKRTAWGYISSFIGVPKTEGDTMLWLIHWPLNHQLEGGDRISCTILPPGLQIKEFGFSCGFESHNLTPMLFDFPYSYPGNKDTSNIVKKVGFELLKGFSNFSLNGNAKIQIYDRLEDSDRITSPQVLHDFIMMSTFEPWYNIPPMLGYQFHAEGSKNCFTVPENPGQKKITWLTSLIKFSNTVDSKPSDHFELHVEITNETKGSKWIYYKSLVGLSKSKSTIVYMLNSLKFVGHEFESGDRVSVVVMTNSCVFGSAINLIYESDEDNSLNSYSCFLFGLTTAILFGSQRNLYHSMCRHQKEITREQESSHAVPVCYDDEVSNVKSFSNEINALADINHIIQRKFMTGC